MLEIKSYEKADDIPLKYLSSLVDSEIECWWSKPFDEFKICNSCNAVYSIEDIYWDIVSYRSCKDKNKNFICKCWNETKLIYPKNEFITTLIDYIKWNVIATLLIDKWNVEWFWILRKTNLNDIIYNKLDYRPDSYNKEIIFDNLFQKYKNDDIFKKDFIYSDQIYTAPHLRKWDISFNLIKEPFIINEKINWNLPIIWETKYDSKFYPISRTMWYDDIISDKYGNVLQHSFSTKKVLDFFKNYKCFSDRWLVRELLKFKKYANNILDENPHFESRKYYV